MTCYFKNLTKLKIDPIPLESHKNFKKPMEIIDDNLYNPILVESLKKVDIYIFEMYSFFSKPGFIQFIHTDGNRGDFVRINFAYCEGISHMCWYELKEGMTEGIKAGSTSVARPYIKWNPDQVKMVASDEIKFPTLVQLGTPHNVFNGDHERLCISVGLKFISTHIRPTMDQACNKLSFWL